NLLACREIPGLQIGTLYHPDAAVSTATERRRREGSRVDPAVIALIGQQDWTTNIVSSAGANCCVGRDRKIGAALESCNPTNLPTIEHRTGQTVHPAEERKVIVVGRDKNVPPVKRRGTVVIMTIKRILAHVQAVSIAAGVGQCM